MITVKNKKVISEVAKTTYKGNKKSNYLAMIAICLTTFLITIVIALGLSYWNTISSRQVRMNGMDYDIELTEPREDQVEKIRSMEHVKYAGIEVKCAIVDSFQDINLEKTRMFWIDQTCWEKQCIPAKELYQGSYPDAENEIMLSGTALEAMGIRDPEIGMAVELTYYTLNDESTDQEMIRKEFILSGFYQDYSGIDSVYVSKLFFDETGVKQTDFTQGNLKITLNNPIYEKDDIVDMQNQIDMDNNQLIEADYDTISNFCKMVIGLAGMLIMIFLSGYLFIYNTLYISITKDIRYYGQLKTIGMTSKQLKSIVYKQALWNSCVGIPIGLLLGIITARGIIPQIIHIANPNLGVGDVVQMNPLLYLIAIVFSFATNMISSKKPATIVGDCSPIEAIRFLKESNMKSGKKHKTRNGGIGSMAIQNIFRDKKQAFIILLSFVIAVSIFFIVNVVIKGNDAKTILNTMYSYDIQFKDETMLEDEEQLLTNEKIDKVKEIEGVKSIGTVSSAEVIVPYQEEIYGSYFKKLYESRFSPGNYEKGISAYKADPENPLFTTRFIGIDENEFTLLNEKLENTIDKEKFENGELAITVDFFLEGEEEGMIGKTVKFYFPNDEAENSITIGAVVPGSLNPSYFSGGYSPDLIVSEKYAQKLLKETVTELIDVTYDQAFDKKTEAKVKAVFADDVQITNDSKLNRYQDMKQMETQVKILGNSIGVIMALLALLNYFNMMVASIQNRSKEFATLESIGMTSNQQCKSFVYEGAGYAAISIVLSIMVGIPLSYAVFQSMNTYRVDYVFPWLSNITLIAIIAAICMVLPVRIYRRTQRGSIVDRLREADL